MTTPEATTLLRTAQLRVTRPRVAVLDQLQRHAHADVDTLARQVRAELGRVSTQAIYDVLSALTEAGLVRRIEPAGSPSRYELQVHDNHHHLVCRACGDIVDVPCAVGERPCLEAGSTHGYEIDEAEVIYWGRCPSCVAASEAPAPSARHRPAEGTRPPSRPSGIPTDRLPTVQCTVQSTVQQPRESSGENTDER